MENYSIVFSSLTGNTKKLAEAIYEVLPKDKCDHFGETGSQYLDPICCISDFGRTKGMQIRRPWNCYPN